MNGLILLKMHFEAFFLSFFVPLLRQNVKLLKI